MSFSLSCTLFLFYVSANAGTRENLRN